MKEGNKFTGLQKEEEGVATPDCFPGSCCPPDASCFLIMKLEHEMCDQTLWISSAHTAEDGHISFQAAAFLPESSQAEHHRSGDFNPSASQEQLTEVGLWLVKPSWGGQPVPHCAAQSRGL